MTAEERKRFESCVVPKKRGGYNGYNNNYGGGAGRGGGRPNDGGMDKMTALRTLGIMPPNTFGQARGVCFNCQRPGHFAKQCPDPPKMKRPRDDNE